MTIRPDDLEELVAAKRILEKPSMAARLASVLGSPIEKGFELLPERWSEVVANSTTAALERAHEVALATLDGRPRELPSNALHKLLVTGAGATGGFFGLSSLAIELPVSTVVMLRSVADVARSHGEPIGTPESKLACLSVFALGSEPEDAAETAYYAVRLSMAHSISKAAEQIAARGLAEAAPAMARLLSQIASKYGAAVSQKVAAQALPIIGAIGGASVNLIFIDHFQNMARGHFTVRKLERRYGPDDVKSAYEAAD